METKTIKKSCENCGFSCQVPRTDEIPTLAKRMVSNWCAYCITKDAPEYQEFFVFERAKRKMQYKKPNNQLKLKFDL